MTSAPESPSIKILLLSIFITTCLYQPVLAQPPQYSPPVWWFGGAAGANFNFYRGSTQQLSADLTPPAVFHEGFDVELFLGPLAEFHFPGSRWAASLQIGYDSRRGTFKEVLTPCNCPANLSTNLDYISVEPIIRLAPFKSNLYIFGGPRLAFNLNRAFTYKLGINPEFPEQAATPDQTGDWSNINKTQISMQVGAGYDIPLSSSSHRIQSVLSPFVSFHPYFGQSPRSVETWNISTLRVGAALKFGRGHLIATTTKAEVLLPEPNVRFTVNSPENISIDRRVRETFPLRNYVFFNFGSTEIPGRYVLLRKDQVKEFKEDQLEVFTPKKLSGRSDREMTVYYNILNIMGDRMGKNPSSTIVLIGSSEKGPEDGRAMAESVRLYLVNVFGIDVSRINVEGRNKPEIPSEQPGATLELNLLREGDRRVSIESSSPALLMEFQSGPESSLKPVEINSVQEAPIDSYVTFNVEGAKEAFTSWALEIRDEKGKMLGFGPFTKEKVSMPGKFVLGNRPEGNYKVKMTGMMKNGKTVVKETNVHMVLWTPSKNEQGMRFSVIFEFNESQTALIYEKYLANVVVPKIPKNGTVILHGHTDVIGDEAYNQQLSLARANEVRDILEYTLARSGRKDVRFEVYGFGEDENLSPFENKFPEERFYNRTVIIDIIPAK